MPGRAHRDNFVYSAASPSIRNLLNSARTLLALSLAYLVADIALNRFAFSAGWTIVWPLNGVTIALLLMRPRRDWLWILLGAEAGTGVGECLDNNPVGLELGARVCSVTEVLISALLLPRFTTLDDWLNIPRLHLRLTAALLMGPGISGLMAAALYYFTQDQAPLVAFNNWAMADALGIAGTLPLALSVNSPQMRRLFERRALPRTLAILSGAFVTAALMFWVDRYPLVFLLYPMLLLVDAALYFSGLAIVAAGVCLIFVYLTINDRGPFAHWPADLALSRDLALQLYFGFHVVSVFPVSMMFMKRRRSAKELRLANAKLTVLASRDGLTGIANRRAFDERCADEWNRAVRSHQPLGLAMIDIDHFKQFNDLYGHLAGDGCLRAVATSLARVVQRPEDLVARFGGEEFALLLPHTSDSGTRAVAEALRSAVLDLEIIHRGSPWSRVTVSIGFATVTPAPGELLAGLVHRADAALYRAKHLGRNRVETLPAKQGDLQAACANRPPVLIEVFTPQRVIK